MSDSSQKMWMALMLREKYNSPNEKKELFNRLKSKYGKSSDEIFMISKESNSGLSYYVFIQEDNMDALFRELQKEKYFLEPVRYLQIPNHEVVEMSMGIEYIRDEVRFGDIVKIKNGRFKKLYGIVLRELRHKKIEIGLKFCFGTVYQELGETEYEVVGNIFNYIKINR